MNNHDFLVANKGSERDANVTLYFNVTIALINSVRCFLQGRN